MTATLVSRSSPPKSDGSLAHHRVQGGPLGGIQGAEQAAHHLRPLITDLAIEPVQICRVGLDRLLVQTRAAGRQVAFQQAAKGIHQHEPIIAVFVDRVHLALG
jgi:hypothetical protein